MFSTASIRFKKSMFYLDLFESTYVFYVSIWLKKLTADCSLQTAIKTSPQPQIQYTVPLLHPVSKTIHQNPGW